LIDPILHLNADDLGRFVLDLETPLEKTAGKALGCVAGLMLFLFILVAGEFWHSDASLLARLGGIVFFFLLTLFSFYLWKSLDCFYVLDDVGGQLLYHFSAFLLVSEDPVANLEDIIGIGVTSTSDNSCAVVIGLAEGTILRGSDFLPMGKRTFANTLASSLAELIKVPVLTLGDGETSHLAVESGKLTKAMGRMLASSATQERVLGCLSGIILVPFALHLGMAPLNIVMAALGDKRPSKEFFLQKTFYGFIPDPKEGAKPASSLPEERSNSVPRPFPSETPPAVANPSTNTKPRPPSPPASQERREAKPRPIHIPSVGVEASASGTIVPGLGIIGLVELGEELSVVYARFGKTPAEIEAALTKAREVPRSSNPFYIPVPEVREDFLDQALSVVFTGTRGIRNGPLNVSQIEVFHGKPLPYQTIDRIGFGASAKEMFDLGDGRGNLGRNEGLEFQARHREAGFFETVIVNGRAGYGVEFRDMGISYGFRGDRLDFIEIKPGSNGGARR